MTNTLLLPDSLQSTESITALFSTNFSSDLPFDPQELIIFCFIGVVCGFAGAGYVAFHRKIVQFNRRYLTCSILQRNRFVYPFLVTLLVTSASFPDFIGKYTASMVNSSSRSIYFILIIESCFVDLKRIQVSTHDSMEHFFSNKSWLTVNPDSETREILKHWQTDHTSIFFHLSIYIVMLWWTSALASTIPVPSGVFIPVFKMGAAFGRIVGELTHLALHGSVAFGASRIPIVPGGYAVVGAAAFAGAVTHTISTTVIVFELTGQMTHIIPVIAAVLIANAIAQSLKPSIYDSIIQIKQLPFLPPIMSTGSVAHFITAQDFMVRDVVCVWIGCTYKQLRDLLAEHSRINCFPLVETHQNMILLGSVQRHELTHILARQLGRERRLQEFQRRYSTQDGAPRLSLTDELAGNKKDSAPNSAALTMSLSSANRENLSIDSDQPTSGTVTSADAKSTNAAPLLKRIGSLNRKGSRFAVTQIAAPNNTGAPGIVASKSTVISLSSGKGLEGVDGAGRPYSSPPTSAPNSPKSNIKSILKPNVSYTISPHSTLGHGQLTTFTVINYMFVTN